MCMMLGRRAAAKAGCFARVSPPRISLQPPPRPITPAARAFLTIAQTVRPVTKNVAFRIPLSQFRPASTSTPTPTSSHSTPHFSSAQQHYQRHRAHNTRTTMYYTASVIVLFIGASYAAVPLYKLICTQTGLDGTPLTAPGHKFEPASMIPVENAQKIRIRFASSVSDAMRWSFVPVTPEIHIVPGETALAFYTAHNPSKEDIVGISTYSVVPAKAAQYFNKIQCFCFEEQKLEAGEEVDMPVFFYIDPEFAYDPWMKDVKTITLHYTFFKSKNQ
ncbi:hypothetical protein PhCBS80983_g04778 [Powellomyces hirtus]|uniref:Cytochrome c oxidase assembly protein CtaG/Cox11 n=1 Tax=Powellomyces hirtus TaxID=109895 RepID=A0A507DX66_9FUNG|nr:hypothetical protein PhCBS80983_g04778 [Powellomyces hirtus]